MLKVIFAGTPEFATVPLQALVNSQHEVLAVYTMPDRPTGRGQKIMASPVKTFAQQCGLTVEQPDSLKNEENFMRLAQYGADVLVDVAWGMFLPQRVLTLPRYGCVNIHPSLLPRWRGAAPLPRALLAGDQETGVTIMQMDEGLDTGAIYRQQKFPITAQDTSLTLLQKAAQLSSQLLLQVLDDLEAGRATLTPQGETTTEYAAKLSKEEGRLMWHLPAVQLERMVRGFNPWPVAYFAKGNEMIRVWRASVVPLHKEMLPGTIVQIDAHGIVIATGKGSLRVEELQFPGKKTVKIKDLLNSNKRYFTEGEQLL